MNAVSRWFRTGWNYWEQFWFTPADPATLGLIRILAGGMLFYTHLVWTVDLEGFFGENGWLSKEFVYRFHDSPFAWSHLYWIDRPALLWLTHILALCVFAALTVGFKSRLSAALAFLLTVSYAHRATGALFGLDQINGFLSLYLMLGPCGDAFSVDRWLQRNKQIVVPHRISTNVAIRLMQLHLCIVYLFAGTGKLLGETWWEGTALWGAFANYEYQTLDMTWLSNWLVLVNLLTHVTLFWEVAYAALIWPRFTRPVMLLLAVPLHLGIAVCMGMVTFGVIMIVANLAFVYPSTVRAVIQRLSTSRTAPKSAPTSVLESRVRRKKRKPVH